MYFQIPLFGFYLFLKNNGKTDILNRAEIFKTELRKTRLYFKVNILARLKGRLDRVCASSSANSCFQMEIL